MNEKVIVALDFENTRRALEFLELFQEQKLFLKVGMELFYAGGSDFLRVLKEKGHRVFLDLKLHDIPNTVERTMRVLTRLGVDMVNLHAAGGKAMMEAAVRGLTRPDGTRPVLLAVTQLTSTDERTLREELLIPLGMKDTVRHYAATAKAAGVDGVVCSPLEADAVHRACGQSFLTVTPGVRFAEGDKGDQCRVTTPAMAKQMGSDYIVVGRPITAAPDPAATYARCVEEFVKGGN